MPEKNMKDGEHLNYEIFKESCNPPNRKSLRVVKGLSTANHEVDRLLRLMTEKDKGGGVSYFHERTTKPVTEKPKGKAGLGVRDITRNRRD